MGVRYSWLSNKRRLICSAVLTIVALKNFVPLLTFNVVLSKFHHLSVEGVVFGRAHRTPGSNCLQCLSYCFSAAGIHMA